LARACSGRANAAAADLTPLTEAQLAALTDIYDRQIREHVHHQW